jgi:hypothetical protein
MPAPLAGLLFELSRISRIYVQILRSRPAAAMDRTPFLPEGVDAKTPSA